MFVVTLWTPPGAGLPAEMVTNLRNAWGGGAITWLSPGEAAAFGVPARPANLWDVWADLQGLAVDIACQPAGNRRKRLLLADMDSTMIGQECIDELADAAGRGAEVAAITARAMVGAVNFEDALRARVAVLAGQPASLVDEVLRARIRPAPGAETLVATLRAHGARCVLVSGGFTAFTGPVAARLGFDAHRANGLEIADGRLTGRVAEPILGREAKLVALRKETAAMGIDASEVIAAGDGANDLAMLEAAGMGVAVHAKPAVQKACELRVNHGDLTALLWLQGYRRGEVAA